MKRSLIIKFALVVAAMLASAGSAKAVIIGSNDGGNCYPFSCFASDDIGGTTYQQVYAASEFSGPLLISSISVFLNSAGEMDDANYTITLSTTSAAVGGLDPTWANNIGGDATVFGTYTVSGSMPAVLTFTGTPFAYDPGMGNLLMQVDVNFLTTAHSYESFFQADYTGAVTSRLWAYGGSSVGDTGTGALVTEFNGDAVVPEPASMAIWGLGALGCALAAYRRRKLRVAA